MCVASFGQLIHEHVAVVNLVSRSCGTRVAILTAQKIFMSKGCRDMFTDVTEMSTPILLPLPQYILFLV